MSGQAFPNLPERLYEVRPCAVQDGVKVKYVPKIVEYRLIGMRQSTPLDGSAPEQIGQYGWSDVFYQVRESRLDAVDAHLFTTRERAVMAYRGRMVAEFERRIRELNETFATATRGWEKLLLEVTKGDDAK